MCPFCKPQDGGPCALREMPDGRIACTCGRHSWPNAGVFLESCRRQSLTITGQVHTWTQGF